MPTHEVRYRYRLRVGLTEALALHDVYDSCRTVWNRALGDWGDRWRAEHHTVGYPEASKALTARRGELDWLGAQPQNPQEQVLRDLYRAVSGFFDKKNPAGRPRFKARKRGYATARWTKNGFGVSGSGQGVSGDRLQVATASGRLPLRVVWSRPLPSVPTSVTVYRDRAGRWFASFVVRVEVPEAPVDPTGRSTGLDMGLSVFATTTDPATDVENPRFARAQAKALARSQRNMARKKAGSKNRAKARRRAARLAARVADQRSDFHHKAARGLVATYDRIGIEDLATKHMARRGKGRYKAGLNRSIADAGWRQFREVLCWQATKEGKTVVVRPARNTTQRCSRCGAKAKPRMELSDRVYRCRACGLVIARDRNSAWNLDPDRIGAPVGGSEPTGAAAPVGDDGKKPKVPAGTLAA